MEIRLVIDAPRGWRVLLLVAMPMALVVGSAALAHAYDTSWIAPQRPVSAAKLKADLDEAQARIAALEARSAAPVVTAWTSFTPALSDVNGEAISSSATTAAFWRRVGDTIEVQAYTTFDSCPSGSTLRWSYPAGVVVDATKGPAYGSIGAGLALGPGTSNVITPLLVTNANESMWSVDIGGTQPAGGACSVVGAGGLMRVFLQAPVAGWTVTGP
jgi:hypothetical protein